MILAWLESKVNYFLKVQAVMIEYVGGLELTNEYWDCECEKKFIHPQSEGFCAKCQVERADQPNSRITEVLKYGFAISQMM